MVKVEVDWDKQKKQYQHAQIYRESFLLPRFMENKKDEASTADLYKLELNEYHPSSSLYSVFTMPISQFSDFGGFAITMLLRKNYSAEHMTCSIRIRRGSQDVFYDDAVARIPHVLLRALLPAAGRLLRLGVIRPDEPQ